MKEKTKETKLMEIVDGMSSNKQLIDFLHVCLECYNDVTVRFVREEKDIAPKRKAVSQATETNSFSRLLRLIINSDPENLQRVEHLSNTLHNYSQWKDPTGVILFDAKNKTWEEGEGTYLKTPVYGKKKKVLEKIAELLKDENLQANVYHTFALEDYNITLVKPKNFDEETRDVHNQILKWFIDYIQYPWEPKTFILFGDEFELDFVDKKSKTEYLNKEPDFSLSKFREVIKEFRPYPSNSKVYVKITDFDKGEGMVITKKRVIGEIEENLE